ncbi:hypothetical protein FHS08_001686 [Microbacterium ulmi]|nr:hypothetical protein [Microbacterium ulmi]
MYRFGRRGHVAIAGCVPGAKRVASKLLACTFGTDALPRAHAEIVAAIGSLAREVSEDGAGMA